MTGSNDSVTATPRANRSTRMLPMILSDLTDRVVQVSSGKGFVAGLTGDVHLIQCLFCHSNTLVN